MSLPTAHSYVIETLMENFSSIEKNFLKPKILLKHLTKTEKVLDELVEVLSKKDFSEELSSLAKVRDALFDIQRAFYTQKGLVADGRDMGTVVFKDAKLKIYLTASVDVRARRRFLELQKRGQEVNMPALIADIEQRDLKDSSRELSPLLPADEAHIIDSSEMSPEEVVKITKKLIEEEYL